MSTIILVNFKFLYLMIFAILKPYIVCSSNLRRDKDMQTSIKPGQVWLDTEGKPIQAHGFSVFYKDGLYYWYGENKEFTKPSGTIWHWGVRCYTSNDLYNWEDQGLIIPPEPDDLQSPLHPTYSMDRPHIIYCEKTKKYVAWLKIMTSCYSQFMCIMQADNFMGPYEFVHKSYHPLKMDSGDFALHVDQATNIAYIIFERPHFELVTATLNSDYTGVTGEYTQNFQGLIPPYTREAPTYFEKDGIRYLYTSGTTGFFPNPSKVAMFKDFHSKYIDLGDPHIDDETNTSFNSQITCVLKIPDKDLYIACADRWLPDKKTAELSDQMQAEFQRSFKHYKPDLSPRENTVLPGKVLSHDEDTRNSTYVWLPIEWEGEKPMIRWIDEWRLEDF